MATVMATMAAILTGVVVGCAGSIGGNPSVEPQQSTSAASTPLFNEQLLSIAESTCAASQASDAGSSCLDDQRAGWAKLKALQLDWKKGELGDRLLNHCLELHGARLGEPGLASKIRGVDMLRVAGCVESGPAQPGAKSEAYVERAEEDKKATEEGHVQAQTEPDAGRDTAEGIAAEAGQALLWYRKAADQGLAQAQYELGFMYFNARGVAEDTGEAARWYRKAADQGHASAQYALGVMYANGTGVPADLVAAHLWSNLAGAAGHPGGKHNRSVYEARMTREQLAEARRQARNWWAAHGK